MVILAGYKDKMGAFAKRNPADLLERARGGSTLLSDCADVRPMLMTSRYYIKGRLMRMDPGLDRRFPLRLDLQDYTPLQIAQIAELKAKRVFKREFSDGLVEKLAQHIGDFYAREIPKQNGGLGVNLTEQAVDKQIERVVTEYQHAIGEKAAAATPATSPGLSAPLGRTPSYSAEVQELRINSGLLKAEDYGINDKPTLGDPEEQAKVMAEVDSLIGMAPAKAFFEKIRKQVRYIEGGGSMQLLNTSLSMIITGNPGVGKTTIARLIARYLHAFGVLPRDRFVEKNGLEMKGKYVGHTTHTVKEAVADAMGGTLFLDEAYALSDNGDDGFSGEAIRTLLTEVENNRTNLLVILAGYEDKMLTNEDALVNADPGLNRRFATRLHLPDYSAGELAEIVHKVATKTFPLQFSDRLQERLAKMIGARYTKEEIRLHNGGLAVQLAEEAFRRLASRCITQGIDGKDGAARILTTADFQFMNEPKEYFTIDAEGNVVAAAIDAGGGATTASTPASAAETFKDFLVQFKLKDLEKAFSAFEEEGILDKETMAAMCTADLKDLGFSIGERARLGRWIGANGFFDE